MALDLSPEAKAKEMERKYEWLEAAKCYEKASHSKSGTSAAEIWQRIGFCYNQASKQTKDLEEFKKLRKLAVEAYKNSAKLFEKEESLENQGKTAQCNAIAEYTRSWLAPSPQEKKKMLDDCRAFGNIALKAFRNAGDELNYGKTCNTLLLCLNERLSLASTEKEKRVIAQEGLDCANKAISVLSKLDNKSELLQAYSIASLVNWYVANISEQEEERKKLANISLRYSKKAMALSKKVDNPYFTALSRWAAALCTLFFTEKIESALENAKEMLQQGFIVNDNYLKGMASYILAFVTDWMILREPNPGKKKKRREDIIKYAEDAIRHLQLTSQDSVIAETYLFYVESYSSLARDFTVNPSEKLTFSKKAVEIGREGLEYAVRSGSSDAIGSTLHALSKALHSCSNLEQRKDKKTKLLEEALGHRNEYIKTVERSFPSNNWLLGVGKIYTAQIETELARLETDKDKKITLLENSISNMEDGISHSEKWISSRPTPSLIAFVAGFEDTFGGTLIEMYQLTRDKEILTRAIQVFNDAAENFRKVNMPSRVAESYWKIARNLDSIGEYQKAARNFESAFAGYKAAAQRIPHFAHFFQDYTAYMKAWSEIERAKSAHNHEDYATAMKHYEKTANLLKQSKFWSYLAPNFSAWSLLEQAEDLSRKESSMKSREAFKKATIIFREAQRTLRIELDRIENSDEKNLAERLIRASDTRAKYCVGRIAVEEARILDKQGDHTASSGKYGSAAETFQRIAELELEQTSKEVKSLIYLCQAWEKMTMAEARASPIMYEEAAELFSQAQKHTLTQSTSMLALANSSFCKALEAGTEFEITRDRIMYSTSKKHMETAANYYLKAGFENASEYAKATQLLFDAYVYMDSAKRETDPEKETRFYMMAEKVLQISTESYARAKHPEKSEQVNRLLEKVREDRELAMSLSEVLHAPTITSSTAGFVTLTPSEESAVGLERFEHANVQANLVQQVKEIKVGEDFNLEIQIVNVGKEGVLLARVEEILPTGFEPVAKPDYCHFEDAYVDMKGKRLDPMKTEDFKFVLRSSRKGTFEIKPKISYLDETGHQMSCEPEPVTINVSEVAPPNRITTGYGGLDKLLFGGIPENYAVILTSPSCDERDLLIKRFLEAGTKKGQLTFYVTIEAGGVRDLAEEHQSTFYLFICNPRADVMIKSLPNVFKLKGVENLTNINIALTSAFRELEKSLGGPNRVCIEIISDVLLQHHAVTTRRWLTGLIPDLRTRGFTTLAVLNPHMHTPQEVHAILGLFEGEISIYEKDTRKGLEKFLRIKKMYKQKYLKSELPLVELDT